VVNYSFILLRMKVSVLLSLCVLEAGLNGIFVAVIEIIRIEGNLCDSGCHSSSESSSLPQTSIDSGACLPKRRSAGMVL
jgi:hypothetical protein